MGTRTGSHQLSSVLIVSGRPEKQLKERQPTMASRAVIYTGGDVKKSGELGNMYGIDISSGEHQAGPPKIPSRALSGSARSGLSSCTLGSKSTNSGSMSKTSSSSSSFSGPATPIQPTSLITSGPAGTFSSNCRPGHQDAPSSFSKAIYGSAVTSLGEEVKVGFRVSRGAMWVFLVVALMGVVIVAWNYSYKKHGVLRFFKKFPDAELRSAVDGQYVKVTGDALHVVCGLINFKPEKGERVETFQPKFNPVVTCGSIPLETSFQRVPRCVYVSSELYEYRGFGGKPANSKHRFFSWGCRHSEKYVSDFYISDSKSGLGALVKSGYGTKVAPFVKPAVVVDVTKDNREFSPNFLCWLSDRNLSSDDRLMRLKEGKHDRKAFSKLNHFNVSTFLSQLHKRRKHRERHGGEPISTDCSWPFCRLPTYIEGLVLMYDETPNDDIIPV
ncbi:hypothetical protein CDL12_05992 [Handroanthus impetiginosus]|uniref:Uncharacterized protein n=1 Tax=Handroanthus impetiginosus TaxID=429701 RepID=A0A2G9HUV1_9LAMI|nr:hypothetical protein CDL12_05992 [Handroanthus impetiginosus]